MLYTLHCKEGKTVRLWTLKIDYFWKLLSPLNPLFRSSCLFYLLFSPSMIFELCPLMKYWSLFKDYTTWHFSRKLIQLLIYISKKKILIELNNFHKKNVRAQNFHFVQSSAYQFSNEVGLIVPLLSFEKNTPLFIWNPVQTWARVNPATRQNLPYWKFMCRSLRKILFNLVVVPEIRSLGKKVFLWF